MSKISTICFGNEPLQPFFFFWQCSKLQPWLVNALVWRWLWEGDMAGTAVQALCWGCSRFSRDVGTCQGGGSGGKEENWGILEGKESLRKTPWNGMALGRGSAGAGILGSVSFWGSKRDLKKLLEGKKQHVSSWDAQGRLLLGFRDFV